MKFLIEKSQPEKDTKVILTVRDSDEQWWKSWCGFMTQEFSRHSIGDFCVAGLLNIIAKKGYMGKEMNAIMEVGMYKSHYYRKLLIKVFILDNRISRNWLGMPEFAETFYAVKTKVYDRSYSYHFGQKTHKL